MFAYYSYFGRARAEQIKLHRGRRAAHRGAGSRARERGRSSSRSWKQQQRAQLEQARGRPRAACAACSPVWSRSHTRARRTWSACKQPAGGTGEAAARAARRPGALPRRRQRRLRPPARQARLAGERAAWWRASARRAPAGVKWDGVLVATERGAPVRGGVAGAGHLCGLAAGPGAAHHRRPRRWLPEPLRPQRAALQGRRRAVAAGDTIAAAGDTGGSSRPELYFEIRKGGKPVDPRPWFKASDP